MGKSMVSCRFSLKPIHWLTMCFYEAYVAYPFKGGGRTQIARHSLDVFEGEGPGKCQQTLFLTSFYLQNVILVGPLTLYGISFIFWKENAGGAFKMSDCIFEKKCKKMKNKCKIVVWRSANSCRIAEKQKCKLKVCRTPIAWYFQYILHFFCTFLYHFHM